jgi:hypothetical protein
MSSFSVSRSSLVTVSVDDRGDLPGFALVVGQVLNVRPITFVRAGQVEV